MYKVSVIIPVYNVDKYLEQCLESVINQTLKDIEIICVNDGSTDNSLAILENYAKVDRRIKIITQENQGLSQARNTGIENACGELIYFLDSDDYIEHTLLENAYQVLSQNKNIDFYCFGSQTFYEQGINNNDENMEQYLQIKYSNVQELNFKVAFNTNIHVWNKVFRLKDLKKYNLHFIKGLLYEDIFFTWYMNFVSSKVFYDKKIYYHYRIRSSSIMSQSKLLKRYKDSMSHLLTGNC